MLVINEDKVLIVFSHLAPPLDGVQLEKLAGMVDNAVATNKPIHIFEDFFQPHTKVCYLRGTLNALTTDSGLHPDRKSDIEKEQPTHLPKPQNRSADAGEKFKVEISGGDCTCGDTAADAGF